MSLWSHSVDVFSLTGEILNSYISLELTENFSLHLLIRDVKPSALTSRTHLWLNLEPPETQSSSPRIKEQGSSLGRDARTRSLSVCVCVCSRWGGSAFEKLLKAAQSKDRGLCKPLQRDYDKPLWRRDNRPFLIHSGVARFPDDWDGRCVHDLCSLSPSNN